MKSAFKVTVRKDGVRFSIDHQSFDLLVLAPTQERCRWYARQLRIALKRLAGGKPNGE